MVSARRVLLRVTVATCLGGGLGALPPPATAASTGASGPTVEPIVMPDAQFEPLRWDEVSGWGDDDHGAAFEAFRISCSASTARKKPARQDRAIDAALARLCREALALGPANAMEARAFFETRFRPFRLARLGEAEGFLTGYYEPIVEGSRVPTQDFKVPMYRRPQDMIVPGRHRPGASRTLSNRGPAWRRAGKKLVPFYDRAEIENGALDGKGLEICWLKDPIDAFFIQIQGSARIRLEDGALLRLNYAAHNGHPYTPVGAILIQDGEIERADMSMDRIRQWMLANPDKAKELRQKNRSFIFFRVAELADHEQAVGAQGVPLTAGRSIAVDRRLHAYGTPLWIDAELPLHDERSGDAFRRLMIAQDTGSAIVGPARGDLYFGAGDEAGRVAGRIKHPARFVMLMPRGIDPAGLAGPVPLPPRRPKP
jgi:membrane-bound lytic murein transglycosylase A